MELGWVWVGIGWTDSLEHRFAVLITKQNLDECQQPSILMGKLVDLSVDVINVLNVNILI